MPPKNEEHACVAALLDLISNLPKDVIDHILLRLRLRDAVRTSILSKKWRYKWCSLPEFTLDEMHLRSADSPQSNYTSSETLQKTMNDVICQLMTFHTGPITKFALEKTRHKDDTPNIDNMIYFLSKNSIQHLVLAFWCSSSKQYSLPSSFFTCFRLRHLSFTNCSIQLPPPEFKGFGRLISLKLCDVTISSKLLGNMISHSLSLEKLVLYDIVMDVDIIEINAPTLRSFEFEGSLRSICLKNVPLLANLSLTDVDAFHMVGATDFDIAKFFESCPALEHLHLDDFAVSPISGVRGAAGEVPTRLPCVLRSVKHLHLACSYTFDPVERVFCLTKSFPNLQFLKIQVTVRCDDRNDKLFDVERHSYVTFNHLREVRFFFATDRMCEMEFFELFLARAPVLVRMIIKLDCRTDGRARQKLAARLSKCKPASLRPEVVILDNNKSHQISFV